MQEKVETMIESGNEINSEDNLLYAIVCSERTMWMQNTEISLTMELPLFKTNFNIAEKVFGCREKAEENNEDTGLKKENHEKNSSEEETLFLGVSDVQKETKGSQETKNPSVMKSNTF